MKWGPVIGICLIFAFIVIAITFTNVIFANVENETDFVNMTAQENASYAAASLPILGSTAIMGVVGWILIAALLIIGMVILAKSVR